jgi:hypothetical protein
VQNLTFVAFRDSFDRKITHYALNWETVGFYTTDGRIYPFGTDTKVISTVFEALAAPIIKEIADEYGFLMEGSDQTIYPDFTLTPINGQGLRIAIDIKTTYRRFGIRGQIQPFRYTLGSYTSFLRTPGATKNIKYPYHEYGAHWIIGFLYTRRVGVSAKVYRRAEEIKALLSPYCDVEYFIQEKYKIVGTTPASGNTTNIGSFPTSDIRELREGKGPFSQSDPKTCDEYWRHYATTLAKREYSNIAGFLAWKAERERSSNQ